jgi:hypothetical protein
VGSLSVVCFWLAGCATDSAGQKDTRARFHESASANLVLRFSRWDTIYMTVPDSRQQDGFLPVLARTDIENQLQSWRGNKDLAVVVFGFLFPGPQEAQHIKEWEQLLTGYGYKRVVILRIGAAKGIDGLLIAHDSAIAAVDDKSPRPLSALAPAFRTDVANPPGR